MIADRQHERRHLSQRLLSLQQSYQRLSETAETLRRRKHVSRIFSPRIILFHYHTALCRHVQPYAC